MIYLDYSESFSDMQRDALERLHEMQKRSKSAISGGDSEPCVPDTSPCFQPAATDPFTNLLSGISAGISGDRLLIIIMLILLYKNKADIKLLLALGYLLL